MLRGSFQFNRAQSSLGHSQLSKPRKEQSPPNNIVSVNASKKQLPQQLLSEVAFEPSKKGYFRIIEQLTATQKVVRLGWRIIQLSLEQIDLGLFCLSMLQSSVNFPFKIFAAKGEQEEKGNLKSKDFWIEWMIMQAKGQDTKGLELAIHRLCTEYLLPRIRQFMQNYINWTYMSSPEYEDIKVINKFKKEIVEQFQLKLEEFKPSQNLP